MRHGRDVRDRPCHGDRFPSGGLEEMARVRTLSAAGPPSTCDQVCPTGKTYVATSYRPLFQ